MHKYSLLIAALFLWIACDEKPDVCKDQSARKLRLGFYSSAGSRVTLKDSAIKSFQAILSEFNDTVNSSSASKVNLPVSHLADSSVYNVTINKTKKVKLFVYYKRVLVFENYKCGYRYNFELDTIVSVPQFCDSIKIIQSTVFDVNQENCRFFFNRDTTMYQ